MADFDELDDDMFGDDDIPESMDEEGRGTSTSGVGATARQIIDNFKDTSVREQASEVAEGVIPKVLGDDSVRAVTGAKDAIMEASKDVRESGASLLEKISDMSGDDSILGSAAKSIAEFISPELNNTTTSHAASNDELAKNFADKFI